MRWPKENPWMIICIGILMGSLCLTEYLINSSIYSLLPLSFLSFYLYIYWALYPFRDNEGLEECWLNRNIDIRIHNVLRNYDGGVHEVKRKVYYVTVGTYGKVVGTYMLILLSNGEVLEYELKYHPATESSESFQELLRTPTICHDRNRIKAIKGWSFAEWWKRNVYTERNRSVFGILLFFAVSIGLVVLSLWIWNTYQYKIVYYFFGYVMLFAVSQHFIGKSEKVLLKYTNLLISIPFAILYIWMGLIHPIIAILGSFLSTGMFAFGVPTILLFAVDHLSNYKIELATKLFVSLSIGSITCVYFSNVVKWFIKNKSPLRDWGNHKYEAVREDLCLYILDASNLNFLIYFLYFLFLAISGFIHFQNNGTLVSSDIDEAVLKAFLVFIAYSNVVKHYAKIKFDFKTFIGKVFKLIFTHDR